MAGDMGDLWVFGYGSLMWKPGFDFAESHEAQISGYHRALCVHSHVHRGTPQHPGLVLGLDRGGSCRGMAFRVEAEATDAVIAYLRARELVTNVYLERQVTVRLKAGASVRAVTYVVDRTHQQYAGVLDDATAAAIVARAVGQSGPNPDYVLSTVSHLRQMRIHDRLLENVVKRLETQAR
jgi:glutathione-specific gamma-glutamylcyclotransferase